MSYGVAVYRLKFDQLLAVRGSQDTALLAELTREYPEEADDEDYDEEEEEEVSPLLSQALAAIINGTPIDDGYWPTYADASLVIYARLGSLLDSTAMSPSNPANLQAVGDALRAEELHETIPIFNFARTPPLLTEAPEPFPVLGHMTPGEVETARGVLTKVNWSEYGSIVVATLDMVAQWIEESDSRSDGLVLVYG